MAVIRGLRVPIKYANTFSDVDHGQALIFKDDYFRMEIALNMGNFVKKHRLATNDLFKLHKQ